MDKDINIKVKVWRQNGPKEKGHFETYPPWKISLREALSSKCWISLTNNSSTKERSL